MNEMEVKILHIDVEEIKKKLHSMGCRMVKSENQVNKIFDFEDRRLITGRGYARIRTVEDLVKKESRSYMTTKKLISADKFKIMSENEVEISDGKVGEDIFASLGLELVETINKYRESFKYKNTLVEIDINDKSFCPFPYLEVESESEDEMKEVVTLLGYSMEDTTSLSIHDILKDYKR